MASAELAAVVDMLRTLSPMGGETIEEVRANMELAAASAPLPEDVRFTPVDAGGVLAEWATAPDAPADRALVYLHGGGYVVGSVRSHRLLVAGLARACNLPVLSVDYRLAPEHPFPAAIEDAVTAVRFVRRTGVPLGRVVLAGDSAGGGLTVATLLSLREAGETLPATAVCISPWLDLTLSGATVRTKADVDPMLDDTRLRQWAHAYLGGADPRTPTASPLFADLRGLPPLLVHVGTAEILLDDAVRFATRARQAGTTVDLDIWDDMIHVWHAFAVVLPEGQQAIERIGAHVRAALGS
jgi:acetyl esterase/lipase